MKEANEKRDKKMRKVKSANAVIGATAIGIPFSLQQGSTDRAVRSKIKTNFDNSELIRTWRPWILAPQGVPVISESPKQRYHQPAIRLKSQPAYTYSIN